MQSLIRVSLVLLWSLVVTASKLERPRVLLPLFKDSSTNFTLRTADNGCYKWSLSRLDIIQIIPLDYDKELDCSSEVLLSTITREFNKNVVIVLVEEVVTKEVLRCDIIVDVITSLSIVTKTRQLFVDESPEIFEVRAYDEQGNEFSTLEGVKFTWTIISGKSNDVSVKNDVIRLINFKDSRYEIPKTVQALDVQGMIGHLALLEGVKTGTANISAELAHAEYRQVPPATVQLNVIANLIIEPSDTYVLEGDVIHYKLLQVKNGRFAELSLPSAQYSLIIENEAVAQQRRPWAIETLSFGQTKLVLSDANSKMSNVDAATYLPSVTLYVVRPAYMNLVLLPHRNWITSLHMQNIIEAELYDRFKHRIHIGPHAIVKVSFSNKFVATEKTRNGSHIYGYAHETGVIPVSGECSSVRTDDNRLISFDSVTAQAEITVYPGLVITPSEVSLPWDPVESLKLNYQLQVDGGDGFYQWAISNTQMAIITQTGIVKPRSIGRSTVTVSMQKNADIQTTARIVILPPIHLRIVHNSAEAELGSPVYLSIAMYYRDETTNSLKERLFTNCSGFPFSVSISNPDFVRIKDLSSIVKAPRDVCTTIGFVGTRPGNSLITISYISDGNVLKDSARISTYEALRMVSPESGKTVLSVGAQRYLVFSGGPKSETDSHSLELQYTESFMTVERVYESGTGESERIYIVTCQNVGDGMVTLKSVNPYAFEGINADGTLPKIHVICAHPKSIRLSTGVDDGRLLACPPSYRAKNMVLDDRPILIRITILDEQGNEFDNATSLSVKWTLSNTELGEILHPGIIKLEEKNEIRYRLPLYHYQVIVPTSQVGNLDVTARIFNYRKTWLKRLGIIWEDKMFKSGSQETLKLLLVHNIHVSSEDVSIFNHPLNIAKVYITYGSGFYKIVSDAEEAAQIKYSEASKSVDIMPVMPATFTLTIRDECLRSDPILVNVQILTISEIQVDVMNKIEKDKSVNAYLTLIDSKGNVVTKQDMVNLKVEMDSNIIRTDCSTNSRSDGHIVCSVLGLELGNVDLVFRAGMDNSIVRSTPVRIQVYPPLLIYPRNITLIPGASLQLTAKGGPQPDCSIIYSVESEMITVDNSGSVVGKELGESYVTGEAIGVKPNGERIVYSVDTVRVNVVHLKGIRLKVPLTKIKSGAKIPIWVEGIPEQINPLVLGSLAEPSPIFKWSVSPPKLAQISNVFEEAGIKVSDSDKLSMRIEALKSGHVVVNVRVTVPRSVVTDDHPGRFSDSINIHIFDDLEILNYLQQPMLLAPDMKYFLKTNKDESARITYAQILNEKASKHDVLNVTKNGLITTRNHYGQSTVLVEAIEDNELVNKVSVSIEVARVQYMMLNFLPHLQMDPESNVFGLPKGAKLRFYVSYHDNKGNQFTATPNDMKYLLSRMENVRLSHDENYFLLDLLDSGISVIKAYDDDIYVFPEYVKINTVPFVQPDNMKLTVGDFICFQTSALSKDGRQSCLWNTSNEHALSIDRETGFAVAKSKQSNILVSFSCANNLQMVTTADVYALQKIEILTSRVPNVSNNGKRIFVPLALLNEVEDTIGRHKLMAEKTCATQQSKLFYPYICDIGFETGNDAVNLGAAFTAYPDHIDKYGHVCVIESKENDGAHLKNVDETNVVLTVSWSRNQNAKITLPFRPAVIVQNTKVVITDQEPIDTLRVDGVPSILNQVRVIPSHEKYVVIAEETTEVKTSSKYSVYLKSAFLKQISPQPQMSVYVISEATDQNISIPLHINVHASEYVSPNYLTEQLTYFTSELLWKIIVSSVAALLIYIIGLKIYNSISLKRTDDSYFYEMNRSRSHLDRSLSSPRQAYQRASFNEIQFIYGRSPEHSIRPRRN